MLNFVTNSLQRKPPWNIVINEKVSGNFTSITFNQKFCYHVKICVQFLYIYIYIGSDFYAVLLTTAYMLLKN
jgi:hypothetical protein